MGRHDYPLTDETREVFKTRYADIAREMGIAPQYLYGVIYGDNPDAYSYFRVLYSACVRADADHQIYDQDLASIRNRYRKRDKTDCPTECLLKKVHIDAQTTERLIKALDDGRFDEQESILLRKDVERIRANCDSLENLLDAKAG